MPDTEALETATLIVPYYAQPFMLMRQLEEWVKYPDTLKVIVVDDGSPIPAAPIVRGFALDKVSLYRIGVDIPWNVEGARNLGAHVAETRWIAHLDIDHVLPAECAERLLRFPAHHKCFYRFTRFRVGRADETRAKDDAPADAEFVAVYPHRESCLYTRKSYWRTGGYDEDYAGALGGGGRPFAQALEKVCIPKMLPEDIYLHVYTKHAVADASESRLSRDGQECKRRARVKEATGNIKPVRPLRFPWERIL